MRQQDLVLVPHLLQSQLLADCRSFWSVLDLMYGDYIVVISRVIGGNGSRNNYLISLELIRDFFGYTLISIIPLNGLLLFLTLKLRKKKKKMIGCITKSAPEKYKARAKFSMESNMSWVFASSAGHIWYIFLLLRYVWKIPKEDIDSWHLEIKTVYGSYYKIYKVLFHLINVTTISIIGFTASDLLLRYLN